VDHGAVGQKGRGEGGKRVLLQQGVAPEMGPHEIRLLLQRLGERHDRGAGGGWPRLPPHRLSLKRDLGDRLDVREAPLLGARGREADLGEARDAPLAQLPQPGWRARGAVPGEGFVLPDEMGRHETVAPSGFTQS